MPSTEMVPRSGARSPSTHSSVVVLPAPFGPIRPKISPSTTSNDTSSTATVDPYVFRQPATLMTGAFTRVAAATRNPQSAMSWWRGSAANHAQRITVPVRIDPRVDEARPRMLERGIERALERVLGARGPGRYAHALRQPAPIHRAERDAGRIVTALLLFDVDEAQGGVVEDDRDEAQPLADRRQQLTGAHQQAAVTGERDDGVVVFVNRARR